MRIAFTMRVVENDSYYEIRDQISHDWIEWCTQHGYSPILLSNKLEDINQYLAESSVDAIILTGGNDVEAPVNSNGSYSLIRNLFEKTVVDYAVENHIPVLAVCRGFQFVNKYFGGSLNLDISKNLNAQEKHVAVEHAVTLTKIFKNMFNINNLVTNSYHNHGVFESNLAEPLVSFANSEPSGLIEAYHHKSLPIIGLQWHPERKTKSTKFDIEVLNKLIHEKTFWES